MKINSYADVSGGITHFGMLGNDVDGDCTVAAYYHIVMAKNTLKASTFKRVLYKIGFKVPGTKFALAEYTAYLKTQNERPGPTAGVAVDSWLDWQKSQGRVKEWQQIDTWSPDSEQRLRQAMKDWGGIILVGTLSKNAYANSMINVLWRYSDKPGDQPDQSLVHAVAYLKFTPSVDWVVTWGEWQSMTITFREKCFEGAFVFKLATE